MNIDGCVKRGFEGKVAWNILTKLKVMGVKKSFVKGVIEWIMFTEFTPVQETKYKSMARGSSAVAA